MRKLLLIAGLASAVLLGGCPAPQDTTTGTDVATTTSTEVQAACTISANRNWTATLNVMPGPNAQPTLIVGGEVDVPSPGYTVTLTEGAADRTATPTQQLILTTTPPAEPETQVITPKPANYSGPAISQTYGGVQIMCNGEKIADVNVTVAH